VRIVQITDASAQTPDERAIPLSSRDLVSLLDTMYPPRCKLRNEDEEEHQRYAGIRTLIDELMSMIEEDDHAD